MSEKSLEAQIAELREMLRARDERITELGDYCHSLKRKTFRYRLKASLKKISRLWRR